MNIIDIDVQYTLQFIICKYSVFLIYDIVVIVFRSYLYLVLKVKHAAINRFHLP